MKTLRIEMSLKQYKAVSAWATSCRCTPEEAIFALGMENLWMIARGDCKPEENVTRTIDALRDYVDAHKAPASISLTLC